MSLFEDNRYQYRDTYFVFFEQSHRPPMETIESSLAELGSRFKLVKRSENGGELEALTFVSPYDHSAMDIATVSGDEVSQQIRELMDEFKTMTLSGDEASKLQKLNACDSRFDIFHFERVQGDEEDEILDPGGLLLVMEKLTQLCEGVALDPQSHSLM